MSIPVVKVPTFTTTLPVSGEKVDFRPFLVKEEKILLLASESDDNADIVNAMSELIESCTFGKVEPSKYSLADLQWLFLQIRGKSISEEIDFRVICGECNHAQSYTINVDEWETRLIDPKEKILKLDSEVTVEMRYPSLKHYAALFDTNDDFAVYGVIADCIVKIYNSDEVFENDGKSHQDIYQFLDNLTPDQFEPFEDFFTSMPILVKEINYNCQKCQTPNELMVDSIRSFFG